VLNSISRNHASVITHKSPKKPVQNAIQSLSIVQKTRNSGWIWRYRSLAAGAKGGWKTFELAAFLPLVCDTAAPQNRIKNTP
jgi:hypothetical protein